MLKPEEKLEDIYEFQAWLEEKLQKIYFCGYSLDVVLHRELFHQLARVVGHEFCYEVSALIMLALKDVESSCMMRISGFGHYRRVVDNSIVEVIYHGTPWIIDPTWLHGGKPRIYARQEWSYCQKVTFDVRRVFTHQEFWRYDFSEELRQSLMIPDLPWPMYLLLGAYRQDQRYGWTEFNQRIHGLAMDDAAQYQFIQMQRRSGIWPTDLDDWVNHFMVGPQTS